MRANGTNVGRGCLIDRNLMHFLFVQMWQKVNLLKAFFARFFSLLTHKMPDTERQRQGDWKKERERGGGGETYTVCPRNWRWVNCQLINSTRLVGKCCCCCLGHQFNVCTLRPRCGRGSTTCLQHSLERNKWLDFKNETALCRENNTQISDHISYLVCGL